MDAILHTCVVNRALTHVKNTLAGNVLVLAGLAKLQKNGILLKRVSFKGKTNKWLQTGCRLGNRLPYAD